MPAAACPEAEGEGQLLCAFISIAVHGFSALSVWYVPFELSLLFSLIVVHTYIHPGVHSRRSLARLKKEYAHQLRYRKFRASSTDSSQRAQTGPLLSRVAGRGETLLIKFSWRVALIIKHVVLVAHDVSSHHKICLLGFLF